MSESESASGGDELTPVIGIFYDSFTSVAGSIAKSKEATVEQTVANLASALVKKINATFSVEPPLSLQDDMLIQYYPALTEKADIHSLPANERLVTLITPKAEVRQAGRVNLKYWKVLNTENKKLVLQTPAVNNESESASGESTLPLQVFELSQCQYSRVLLVVKGQRTAKLPVDNGDDLLSLQKTMADLQAMVAQHEAALAKEKADRVAASARERADRKAEMTREKADRKVEMALRIAEINKLEQQLEKQKDENDQLLEDLQSKQNKLTKQMSEHAADMKYISEVRNLCN
jgi:hypothetical protein